MGADVADYPPRLLITAQSNLDFTSPKICVDGLDRKCGFNLFISVFRKDQEKLVFMMSYYAFFYQVMKVQQNPNCKGHHQLLHKVSFLHSFCFSPQPQRVSPRLPMGHFNSILAISISSSSPSPWGCLVHILSIHKVLLKAVLLRALNFKWLLKPDRNNDVLFKINPTASNLLQQNRPSPFGEEKNDEGSGDILPILLECI